MTESNSMTDQEFVYRVQLKHWILYALGAVSVSIFFVFGLDYLLPRHGKFIGLAICLVFAVVAWQTEVLPMLRTILIVGKYALFGRADRMSYKIFWGDILASRLFYDQVKKMYRLWIVMEDDFLDIPLRFLDAERIGEQIRDRVGPGVFGNEAYERWRQSQELYQKRLTAESPWLESQTTPLRVRQKR